MKRILFFSLFFINAFSSYAQIIFQRTYGIGIYNEGRSVKQTFDGGYIIAGSASDAGTGGTDVYLLKVDSLGNFQWNKLFGGTNIDHGYAVEQLSDSGYAVAGYTNSFGNGGYDAYLIRTDKNGDTLWTRTFGTPDWDFIYSMVKTSDGGLAVAGNSYGNASGASQAWVFKTDLSGTMQWSRQFSIPMESFLNAIIETPEHNFVAVGYQTGGLNNSEDMLALKLSSTGDSIWSHSFGNTGDDIGTSIHLTNDSNYIIGGTINNTGTTFNDYYLLRTDTSGSEQWHQEFVSSAGDYLYSVRQLHNGGYATCGITNAIFGNGSDVSLILADNNGGFSTGSTYGTPQNDFAYDMNQCSDNGFIIVGKTDAFGPAPENVYLIKTDSIGHTNLTLVVATQEMNSATGEFLCYPNPAEKFLHLLFKNLPGPPNEKFEINIYDLSGQKVFCQNGILRSSTDADHVVNVEHLESGCYVLSVVSAAYSFKRKLLISR